MEFQYVHGSHGKTSAIDQAADVSVKFNEVQAVLLGLHLDRIFLRNISQRVNVLLAEFCIIVEAELRVHATE